MLDRLITELDRALRTLAAPARTGRPLPGGELPEAELDETQRSQVGALMRINHVGEICAQALYQGQALTCREPAVRDALRRAAVEETEHLSWTASRMAELGSRPSLLNPLWYGGALMMGVAAGLVGKGLARIAAVGDAIRAEVAERVAMAAPGAEGPRASPEGKAQRFHLACGAAPFGIAVIEAKHAARQHGLVQAV